MLTVDQTPWGEVRAVSTVGSSNVVYKFEGGGPQDLLWIKGAPGLNRVQFANETMSRLGLPANSRVIAWGDNEHATVLDKVTQHGDQESRNKLNRIRQQQLGLLVMPNAGSATYFEHMEAQGGTAGEVAEHLRLLGLDSVRNDIARIIAADLLLGNYDRFGADAKFATLHQGNFALDLSAGARFVPIDNDVVSPSFEHVLAQGDGPATPEQLYAVVIHGGALKDDNRVFPSANQSSLSALLGQGAVEKIAQILQQALPAVPFRGADPYARERQQILQYAAQIAPLVRQYMQTLLGELKQPGGRRAGLNALMKAQQNVEGMNYDTFKLKSRFAALMVDAQNLEPAEVDRRALAYQKYRYWKQQLPRLFGPAAHYPLPAQWVGAKKLDFVSRAFDKRVNESTDVAEAHKFKKDIRKGLLDELAIRREWDQFKNKPDSDQSIVKAKLVCISKLYYYDLENRSAILDVVIGDPEILRSWVGQFYLNAIRKRANQFAAIRQGFRTSLNSLLERLKADSNAKEWNMVSSAFKRFDALSQRV